MSREGLAEFLKEAMEKSKRYKPCMSLHVSEESLSVELILDPTVATYGEWIEGEGADICLYRSIETKEVIGCRLPLKNKLLGVSYDGPIRVNSGFRNQDEE